jgi:hypothetical protein
VSFPRQSGDGGRCAECGGGGMKPNLRALARKARRREAAARIGEAAGAPDAARARGRAACPSDRVDQRTSWSAAEAAGVAGGQRRGRRA